jgi:hypothetical protein
MSQSGKKAREGGGVPVFCSILLIRMGLTLLKRRFSMYLDIFTAFVWGKSWCCLKSKQLRISIVRFSQLISGN